MDRKMGAHPVPDPACLDQAHARDRGLAEAMMERLLAEGRGGHPAIAHLGVVLADKVDHAHFVSLAAVAFETAVRVHHGNIAGAMAKQGKRHESIAAYLVDRTPTDWESRSRRPYTEVDWRRLVAATAEEVRRGTFEIPMTIPGAHLFVAFDRRAESRDAFVSLMLGETVRDDTLDPVATSGNFLAQAMPGYADLDLLFRQHREAMLSKTPDDD
jgi:hypothetical protein